MSDDPYINKVIFSKYQIKKKIGKGSFGIVYSGIITLTNEKVAIKMEKKSKNNNETLETEAYRLIYLQHEGIPKIICYGNNQTHNILVQELLGSSLEEIFNSCGKKFSLKTVCVLGIEMLRRIQFVHSRHHIHRDIKPDNFMTGINENDNKIYIIDFGLSKKYYSTSKKQHIKFSTGKSLTGTARYCARNAHKGFEQSRRDDIESIGYVLMYFLIGNLPWQGLKIKVGEDQFKKIADKKINTSFEVLTKNQPIQFLKYFQHCDKLNFEDEPDYDYLIGLFQEMINQYCNDCFYDFDWKKDHICYMSIEQEKNNFENYKSELNKSRDVSLIVNNQNDKENDKDNDDDIEDKNNLKNSQVFYHENNGNNEFYRKVNSKNNNDRKKIRSNSSLINNKKINENDIYLNDNNQVNIVNNYEFKRNHFTFDENNLNKKNNCNNINKNEIKRNHLTIDEKKFNEQKKFNYKSDSPTLLHKLKNNKLKKKLNSKISNEIIIEDNNNDKDSNKLTSRKNTKIIEIEIETSGQNNEISLKEIKFEEDKNKNESSTNNNNSNKITSNNSNIINKYNKISNNNSNNLSNNNTSYSNIKKINDNQIIEKDKSHIFPRKRHRNKSMDDKIGEISTDTKCKCIIF